MTNPIPQRLPNELVQTELGRYLQQLVNAAFHIRLGNPVTVPQNVPEAQGRAFIESLAKVLDQINKGEQPNVLDYIIPFTGEAESFFKEFLDAVEQLR